MKILATRDIASPTIHTNKPKKHNQIQHSKDSFKLSFKSNSKPETLFDDMSKPHQKTARIILKHLKKSDLEPKTMKLLPLKVLQIFEKKAVKPQELINYSMNASLKGKQLLLEGLSENNKDKVKESSEYLAFALRAQCRLDEMNYLTDKAQDAKLARSMDLTRNYIILTEYDNAEFIIENFIEKAPSKIKNEYSSSIGTVHDQLGSTLYSYKKPLEAISHIKKAMQYFKQSHNNASYLSSKLLYARACSSAKEQDCAIENFKEVIEAYEKNGNNEGIFVVKSHLAKSYLKKSCEIKEKAFHTNQELPKKYYDYIEKAMECNNFVIQNKDKVKNSKFVYLAYDHLSKCHLANKNPDLAIKYSKMALKSPGITNIKKASFYSNLANGYHGKGDYFKQLKYKCMAAQCYLSDKKTSLNEQHMLLFKENIENAIAKQPDFSLVDDLKELNFDNKQILKEQLTEIIDKYFKNEA